MDSSQTDKLERAATTAVIGNQLIPEDVSILNSNQLANTNPKPKVKKEKVVIDSVEGFITHSIEAKKAVFNDHLLRSLKGKANIPEETSNQLVLQAYEIDLTLELSRQFMLAALHAYTYPRVSESLRMLAKAVICRRLATTILSEETLFPLVSENSFKFREICSRVTMLLDENTSHLKSLEKDNKINKDKTCNTSELEKYKNKDKALKNAVYASAAWRIINRVETPDQIVCGLHQLFLSYKHEARQREIDIISMLCGGSPEKQGLSALLDYHLNVYEQEKQKNSEYSTKLTRSESIIKLKQQTIDEQTAKIEEQSSNINLLKQELAELQEQRHIDLIHFRNVKEQQRSHTLKTLENDNLLISESLVALTREPPKVSVAQNYMSRVNESLKNEIYYLKDQK